MFIRLCAVAAAAAIFTTGAAQAATVTLDFDGTGGIFASGGGLAITDDGVTFGLSSSGGAGPALFNSDCGSSCNGDADLQPPVQGQDGVAGNVLIQQNPSVSGPNDDPNTQFLTITILDDIELIWTGVSLVDDGVYTASTSLDAFLGTASLVGNSSTDALTFSSSVLGMGDSVTVSFFLPNGSAGASGAIDRLTFDVAPIPLPAAGFLLLGGLGGLMVMRRRSA